MQAACTCEQMDLLPDGHCCCLPGSKKNHSESCPCWCVTEKLLLRRLSKEKQKLKEVANQGVDAFGARRKTKGIVDLSTEGSAGVVAQRRLHRQ
eukprot:1156212-Pelagomonas_calceolata.AAC.7